MSEDCPHLRVVARVEVNRILDGIEPFTTLKARALHLHAHCQDCGHPFRFVGAFGTANIARQDFGRTGPWANADGSEIALWIEPGTPHIELATMPVAGRG